MSNARRCAACKYLRRRCPKDCIFGPYFPATNLERFACVHKIFGASNVAKMLKQLPEGRKREAAESLVQEASSRVRDPVYGSVGMIAQLKQQIMEAEYELARTHGLIALRRAQHLHEQQILEAETNTIKGESEDYMPFDHSLLLNPHEQQSTSLGDLTIESYLY